MLSNHPKDGPLILEDRKGINAYLKQQHQIVNADALELVIQQQSLRKMRRHWWIVLGAVISAVLIVVTIVIGNMYGCRMLYPKLFRWWDRVYSPQRRYCIPNTSGGSFEVTAMHIAMASQYPTVMSVLNALTLVKAYPKIGIDFLLVCVQQFGEQIDPMSWCGDESQLQGVDPCVCPSDSDTCKCQPTKGAHSTLVDCFLPLTIQAEDASACDVHQILNDETHISPACLKEETLACWAASCGNGNPFFDFFPKDAVSFMTVRSINEYLIAGTKTDTKLFQLYQGGLCGLGRVIGNGKSGMTGAQWFEWMFLPYSEDSAVYAHHEQCTQQSVLNGITTGAGATGAFMGVGALFGPIGLGVGFFAGMGAGLASALSSKSSCDAKNHGNPLTTIPRFPVCEFPNKKTTCGSKLPVGFTKE